MLGSVEVCGLVEDLSALRHHHETVRETGRNPKHFAIAATQRFPHPLAECRRMPPEIERHVVDFSAQTANQLSLRVVNLIVETANHIPPGERLIVLNERTLDTQFRQSPLVVAFEKSTAGVLEDLRFKQLDICNAGRDCLHRYAPLAHRELTFDVMYRIQLATCIPINTSCSCCCQGGSRKPKAWANLSLASTELAGRLAGVG